MAGDQINSTEADKRAIRHQIDSIQGQILDLVAKKAELAVALTILEKDFIALYRRIGDDWK